MAEAQNAALTAFLMQLAKEAPQLFQQFLAIAVKYYDGLTQGVPATPTAPQVGEPIDVTGDDGTGSYTLVSKPVPDSVRKVIREQFARGIIYEEAAQWLSGFITGFFVGAGA